VRTPIHVPVTGVQTLIQVQEAGSFFCSWEDETLEPVGPPAAAARPAPPGGPVAARFSRKSTFLKEVPEMRMYK
jgi:hypothetical protein